MDDSGGVGRNRAGCGQLALDLTATDAVGKQVSLLDMGQVAAPEIGDR